MIMINQLREFYAQLESCDLKIIHMVGSHSQGEFDQCIELRKKYIQRIHDGLHKLPLNLHKKDLKELMALHKKTLSRDRQIQKAVRDACVMAKEQMLKVTGVRAPRSPYHVKKSQSTAIRV